MMNLMALETLAIVDELKEIDWLRFRIFFRGVRRKNSLCMRLLYIALRLG